MPDSLLSADAKGFPGGGKELPSRGRAALAVSVVMHHLREKAIGRTGGIFRRPSRFTGLARALAGILLLALHHSPVQAFTATPPLSHSVTLEWDRNSNPDEVAGYRVYYGVASRDYSNTGVAGNATTNRVHGLASGVTYFFAVTAYDASGLESEFSDEVSYTVPEAIPRVRMQTFGVSGGHFALTVAGRLGHTYDIEATQDLSVWTFIGTVTVGPRGSVIFADPNAADFPQRFYRARPTHP